MSRIPIQELRRMGVSQEDIEIAKQTQAAQRRNGSPVQSIGVIVGAVQQRARHNPNPPVNLADRAMRKRGTYDQAALLADQAALQERSPERAMLARQASKTLKELSAAQQLEFDFFGGGNVSIAFQYQDAVTERLFEAAKTTAQAKEALSILWTICRHLGWQTYECTKTAADLCEITRTKAPNMADALKLLEQVGAIHRVKRGRVKIITVTPEGAFRGNVNNHAQAVERYKLDVIEGGKSGNPEESS
jgi:DNA-binding MarR family transcriptional regulator